MIENEPIESRAFWVVGRGRGEIRACEVSVPGPGEVRVRALVSAVSRGTESLVFTGRVPVSQHAAMRCPFQEGTFPAPVKYGYASVGVVEALGDGVAPNWNGRRVFCLYPHQALYVVPEDALTAVPADVPDARAALAANMETAVNALWDGAPRVGDRIVIVGAGVVGALVAALVAQIPGTDVTIVDRDPRREALATGFGVRFASPECAPARADLVFHASGQSDGLATALAAAGFEATVVELSWYGDDAVAVPLGEQFHSGRLRILSSQVGQVASARRARRSHRDRRSLAMSLLADPRYDALVTGTCALDDVPATMARLATAPDGALCQIVDYR